MDGRPEVRGTCPAPRENGSPCGEAILWCGIGRPPTYCDATCREAMERQRQYGRAYKGRTRKEPAIA